jgi:hypothetical protein
LSSQLLNTLEGNIKTKEDFSALSYYRENYYKEDKETIKEALLQKKDILTALDHPFRRITHGAKGTIFLFNINKKIDKFANRFFQHDSISFHLFVHIFEHLFNTIFFHRTNEHVVSEVLENLKDELIVTYRASIKQLEYQASKRRPFYLGNIVEKISRLVNEIDNLDQYTREIANTFEEYNWRSIIPYSDLTETIGSHWIYTNETKLEVLESEEIEVNEGNDLAVGH